MSEIQRLPATVEHDHNPVHPNAKTTTHVNNGTTTTKTNITSPVCRNCKTQTTPLWRRDETGQVLCNACGLFLKLHGRPRPISLKTDTIKSRNRIKQPSSAKSSSPNTPELKSKDSKQQINGIKKSPKPKKKSTQGTPHLTSTDSNVLTPLLPAANGIRSHQPQNSNGGQYLPQPTPSFQFANHLQHQVQPLHYPSSTPTQFAPGLQRITSPLLLSSSSSSSSNARSASGHNANISAAVQAASTLENMSHELGPSASFKSAKNNNESDKGGVSLLNKGTNDTLRNSTFVSSTPSSALNVPGSQSKLPSIVSPANSGSSGGAAASPSFGIQFHLTQDSTKDAPKRELISPPKMLGAPLIKSPENNSMSLPPISQVSSIAQDTSLPHFQSNFFGHGSSNRDSSSQEGKGAASSEKSPTENQDNEENSNRDNNEKNNHEATLLKTRISELELVNDLYRTRIMELEAMEQAARLREISMRKRLDEFLALQEKPSSKRGDEEQASSSSKRPRVDA